MRKLIWDSYCVGTFARCILAFLAPRSPCKGSHSSSVDSSLHPYHTDFLNSIEQHLGGCLHGLGEDCTQTRHSEGRR